MRARGATAAALLAAALLLAACGLGVRTLSLSLQAAGPGSGHAVAIQVPVYTGAGRAAPAAVTGWPLPPGYGARSARVTVMAPAAASLVAAWNRQAFTRLGFRLTATPDAKGAGWWEFARGNALVGVHLKPIGGGETQITYVGLVPKSAGGGD